jgi:hypothetical protein
MRRAYFSHYSILLDIRKQGLMTSIHFKSHHQSATITVGLVKSESGNLFSTMKQNSKKIYLIRSKKRLITPQQSS